MNRTLHISQPQVSRHDGKVRLSAIVTMESKQTLWIEFDEAYAEYVCWERSDAFLLAVLPIAMRRGLDIECEAPIGEELFYQLREYLLPALNKGDRRMYDVEIKAMVDTMRYHGVAVGTGISCGIDSLYSIFRAMNSEYPNLKLTHVTMFNVGAFFKKDGGQFAYQCNLARNFACEHGLKLVVADSNFTLYDFPGKLAHHLSHVYNNAFAVFALQKLWGVYYYSSGFDFSRFSTKDNFDGDPSRYDLLFWDAVSTSQLRFYNSGGAVTRYQKTAALVDYEPASHYLNVCIKEDGQNCGECFKCKRTLVTLDALGALDKFDGVFDIMRYKAHRHKYLFWMVRQKYLNDGDGMIDEAYDCLRGGVPRWLFVSAILSAWIDNLGGRRILGRFRTFVASKVRG